jgi:hypothetical protein
MNHRVYALWFFYLRPTEQPQLSMADEFIPGDAWSAPPGYYLVSIREVLAVAGLELPRSLS